MLAYIVMKTILKFITTTGSKKNKCEFGLNLLHIIYHPNDNVTLNSNHPAYLNTTNNCGIQNHALGIKLET